jgi:hypothetical protein
LKCSRGIDNASPIAIERRSRCVIDAFASAETAFKVRANSRNRTCATPKFDRVRQFRIASIHVPHSAKRRRRRVRFAIAPRTASALRVVNETAEKKHFSFFGEAILRGRGNRMRRLPDAFASDRSCPSRVLRDFFFRAGC